MWGLIDSCRALKTVLRARAALRVRIPATPGQTQDAGGQPGKPDPVPRLEQSASALAHPRQGSMQGPAAERPQPGPQYLSRLPRRHPAHQAGSRVQEVRDPWRWALHTGLGCVGARGAQGRVWGWAALTQTQRQPAGSRPRPQGSNPIEGGDGDPAAAPKACLRAALRRLRNFSRRWGRALTSSLSGNLYPQLPRLARALPVRVRPPQPRPPIPWASARGYLRASLWPVGLVFSLLLWVSVLSPSERNGRVSVACLRSSSVLRLFGAGGEKWGGLAMASRLPGYRRAL